MLVLTRKSGQKLIINDNIEIVILETHGDAVKIGIKAPKNVSIYREEIYEEIKKSNIQSGKQSSESLSKLLNIIPTQEVPNKNLIKEIGAISNKPKQ